jgi:hypothetical protein
MYHGTGIPWVSDFSLRCFLLPFCSIAANTGVMTFMDNMEVTQNLPVGLKTVAASVAAGLFRIFLMPVDTVKVCFFLIGIRPGEWSFHRIEC